VQSVGVGRAAAEAAVEGSRRPLFLQRGEEVAEGSGQRVGAGQRVERRPAKARASRSRKLTATRSCSRYCSSVLPPSPLRLVAKKAGPSASHSGRARPVTPS